VRSAESLEAIRSEGRRILDLGRRDPSRPVPQYPGWTMTDLVSHTASVLGRTISICRDHPTERIAVAARPEGLDVFDWYEATLDEMVATLEESDPETPVWGFWPRPSIGLWERRMVIETGIHRWDAGQALGEEGPLHETVAVSGLEEYADMWLPRLGEMPILEVTATDLGRSWVYGSGTPVATVGGTASDLYLRLMSRPSPVTLPYKWAVAVDALEPPKR
jgi:uncharacterized protein (TIGR03083 family)